MPWAQRLAGERGPAIAALIHRQLLTLFVLLHEADPSARQGAWSAVVQPSR